jgi:hypothetical protein
LGSLEIHLKSRKSDQLQRGEFTKAERGLEAFQRSISKLKPRQFSQIGNDLEMLIVSHFEPLRFGFYANIQNFVAQVSRFGKRQRER